MNKLNSNIAINFIGQTLVILIIAICYKMLSLSSVDEAGVVIYAIALLGVIRAVSDLGVSKTLIRQISKFRLDILELKICINHFSILYLIIASLYFLLAIYFSSDLISVLFDFKEGEITFTKFSIFFYAGVFVIFISFLSNVLIGLERFIELNFIDVLFAILTYSGVTILIIINIDWYYVGVYLVSIYGLKFIVLLFFLNKESNIKIIPRFNYIQFKRTKSHLFHMIGLSILIIFNKQLDKVLVGWELGISEAGFYVLCFSLVSKFSIVTQSIAQAATPFFSASELENSNLDKVLAYKQIYRMNLRIMFPIYVVIAVFSDWIVTFLLNDTFSTEYKVTLWGLLFYFLMNSSIRALRTYLIANEGARLVLIADFIGVLLSVPLMIFGIAKYGLNGLVFGMLFFYFGMIPLLVNVGYRYHLNLPSFNWLQDFWEAVNLSILLAIPLVLLFHTNYNFFFAVFLAGIYLILCYWRMLVKIMEKLRPNGT